jgi:prevent-host-death family protein
MTSKKISVDHSKSNFDEILRRVEVGESFMITKQGRPIVDIVPSRSVDRAKTLAVISNILSSLRRVVFDRILTRMRVCGRR